MNLPVHTVTRRGRTSVWQLATASGDEIALFSDNTIKPAGGVFVFHPNKGWTKEQADAAIRAAIKKGTP